MMVTMLVILDGGDGGDGGDGVGGGWRLRWDDENNVRRL
jgi:hypothetical protein